jgi:signal transduction histidine kinase
VHGYVRAGETINEARGAESALDFGLITASVLAIIAATAVGGTLASAAVLQREQSYERLREFTADASHELRTPLTALAATAGLALLEAPHLPQTTHRHLKTIVSLSDQMRKLVDDLLILARANKSLEREMFVVPVDAMLQRVNSTHASFAAEKCVNLLMHQAPPIPIFGNPDQLERIVSNLVENAIRYTEPGGTVEASCSCDYTALRLAVRDTGIGIAAEHRERIFDRLWRGDNARGDGGAGLGLSIARALARRHGGDIAVWSEPGIGSVFTLTLPRRPPLPR